MLALTFHTAIVSFKFKRGEPLTCRASTAIESSKGSSMGLNHKVIFGMKLRQYREAAGLSLTRVRRAHGAFDALTSPRSNTARNIPEAKKIARMAEVLGRNYDDLVSIRLDEELSPLASFLGSPCDAQFSLSPVRHIAGASRRTAHAPACRSQLACQSACRNSRAVQHRRRAPVPLCAQGLSGA